MRRKRLASEVMPPTYAPKLTNYTLNDTDPHSAYLVMVVEYDADTADESARQLVEQARGDGGVIHAKLVVPAHTKEMT